MSKAITETLSIRKMERKDLDLGIKLAREAGWNPGIHDADPFYAADPNGYMIGFVGDNPVGCISAVSYHGIFGFMGFYIVMPEHRGKGYGMQLFRKAQEYLSGQNVGGDGVLERLDDYQTVGFNLAYKNHRFEFLPKDKAITAEEREEIVPIENIPFEFVLDYDTQCFPTERRRFLEKWLQMPESFAFGFFDDARLQGYGVLRKCFTGYKIGPLFADTTDIAEALFRKLCACANPGEPIYLDVPEVNLPGMEIAKRYGMKEVFATGRIYTGEAPDIALEKIYGVTTFELG